MATHISAKKRIRQNLKKGQRNSQIKSRVGNLIKKIRFEIQNQNQEAAQTLLQKAIPLIDQAASQRTIHWKNVSRKISRLTKLVNKGK